jgi:hypothetical protein
MKLDLSLSVKVPPVPVQMSTIESGAVKITKSEPSIAKDQLIIEAQEIQSKQS